MTGIAISSTELTAKWLPLTREALGKVNGSIAVLANPGALACRECTSFRINAVA